jgi:hypothetical protein
MELKSHQEDGRAYENNGKLFGAMLRFGKPIISHHTTIGCHCHKKVVKATKNQSSPITPQPAATVTKKKKKKKEKSC